ncbi:unnamed protein product [Schistocephalus solidus]|uniref:Uncharacterized protein n=1 Tax=Schistocephalus solidus TaxID=70667 RepID=A0A183TF46_SCHSO|nr:unnamed protein product [Schistocephalus solidus]
MLKIIRKRGDITTQSTDAVVDVHTQQSRANNGALGNTTYDHNLCRLPFIDMDKLKAAKTGASDPFQEITPTPVRMNLCRPH